MRSNHNNYHRRNEGAFGIFLFIFITVIVTIITLSFFLFNKTKECTTKDIIIRKQDSTISAINSIPLKEVVIVKHDTLYLEAKPDKKLPPKVVYTHKDSLLVPDSIKTDVIK